mgnify:CR=1 FL=1
MQGDSLRTICKRDGMPSITSVFRWLGDEANQAFRDQYAQAREVQADVLAEQTIDIADDSSGDETTDADGNPRFNAEYAARSRLRIDARKWFASKLAPKKYGDKSTVDVNVNDSIASFIGSLGAGAAKADNGDMEV